MESLILDFSSQQEEMSKISDVPLTIGLDFDPVEFHEAAKRGIQTYKSCINSYFQWRDLPVQLKNNVILQLDTSLVDEPKDWSTDDVDDYREAARIKILINAFDEVAAQNTIQKLSDCPYLLPDQLLRMDLKIAAFRLSSTMNQLLEWSRKAEEASRRRAKEKAVWSGLIKPEVPSEHRSVPHITFTYTATVDDQQVSRSLQLLDPHQNKSKEVPPERAKAKFDENENEEDDSQPPISIFSSVSKFPKLKERKRSPSVRSQSVATFLVDVDVHHRAEESPASASGASSSSTVSIGEVRDDDETPAPAIPVSGRKLDRHALIHEVKEYQTQFKKFDTGFVDSNPRVNTVLAQDDDENHNKLSKKSGKRDRDREETDQKNANEPPRLGSSGSESWTSCSTNSEAGHRNEEDEHADVGIRASLRKGYPTRVRHRTTRFMYAVFCCSVVVTLLFTGLIALLSIYGSQLGLF